jgi:hypothetical protein
MSYDKIIHIIVKQYGTESGTSVYKENGAKLAFMTFIQTVPPVKYFQSHLSKHIYGKFCINVTRRFISENQLHSFYLKMVRADSSPLSNTQSLSVTSGGQHKEKTQNTCYVSLKVCLVTISISFNFSKHKFRTRTGP